MVMDFACENYGYQLCNTDQNQIRMQSLFILCASSGKAEIFFDVINISFHGGSYFAGVIPIFASTNNAGICTKIFLGIYVYHSSGNRRSTRIFTMTNTTIFAIIVFIPCGHGTDEFLTSNAIL